MKNKKITYILVPLVLLIWGLAVIRIISMFNQKDDEIVPVSTSQIIKLDSLQKDTFTLYSDYPDPFFKGSVNPIYYGNTDNQGTVNTPNIKAKLIKKVQWPEIRYGGIILSKKTGKINGLLIVKESRLIIHDGILCDSIKVLKIFRDSVVLELRKSKKTVNKTNLN